METLTKAEEMVYQFMLDYQAVESRPPTLQEISQNCFGLNWRSSARYVVSKLAEKQLCSLAAPTNYSRRYKAVRCEK
jgi:hypothetical protein